VTLDVGLIRCDPGHFAPASLKPDARHVLLGVGGECDPGHFAPASLKPDHAEVAAQRFHR